MAMFRIVPLTLILLLCLTATYAQQTPYENNNCHNSDGTYYVAGATVRYEYPHRRVVFDKGSEVKELETSVDFEQFGVIDWSPDCRYMVALTDFTCPDKYNCYNGGKMILWDTVNAVRLHTFAYPRAYHWTMNHPRINWSPTSQHALFRTSNGFYIWDAITNNIVMLSYAPGIKWRSPNLDYIYWDYERNQFIINGFPGVMIFDLISGAERGLFTTGGTARYEQEGQASVFKLSDDGSKLIVFSDPTTPHSSRGSLTIWDLNNLTGTQVNVERRAALSTNLVALSPDNRHLVIGYDALRVWDIQNLPENVEDRLPIYRHGGPESPIWSVRFADWGVIETTSAEGVQKWDLHTGVYIQ
jgi:WD40 repeat protein